MNKEEMREELIKRKKLSPHLFDSYWHRLKLDLPDFHEELKNYIKVFDNKSATNIAADRGVELEYVLVAMEEVRPGRKRVMPVKERTTGFGFTAQQKEYLKEQYPGSFTTK